MAWDQVLPPGLGTLNKLRLVRCLQRDLVQILVHSRCVLVKSSKINGTSKRVSGADTQVLACKGSSITDWRWVTTGLRIQLPKGALDLTRAQ